MKKARSIEDLSVRLGPNSRRPNSATEPSILPAQCDRLRRRPGAGERVLLVPRKPAVSLQSLPELHYPVTSHGGLRLSTASRKHLFSIRSHLSAHCATTSSDSVFYPQAQWITLCVTNVKHPIRLFNQRLTANAGKMITTVRGPSVGRPAQPLLAGPPWRLRRRAQRPP